MGIPCVFIRFSGCNLRCAWCDTPYASWHPEGENRDMAALLELLAPWPGAAVVITGGEPFLFPELAPLCRLLKEQGRAVGIETSGSIYQNVPCDLLVISPKGAGSDPDAERHPREHARHVQARSNREPLRQLLQDHPGAILKCVVNRHEDVEEIQQQMQEWNVPARRVWLMPCAAGLRELEERGAQVAQWALENGFCYSDRLHVRLWGNAKGR